MAAEAGGILDTRNTSGIQNFDGTDANWESWRVKFAAYAYLAGVGAFLDVAAEQTAFIMKQGLDAAVVLVSKSAHAFLLCSSQNCKGKALSVVSPIPRIHGLEAWRVFKDEYEEEGGNCVAALLRRILNPRAR